MDNKYPDGLPIGIARTQLELALEHVIKRKEEALLEVKDTLYVGSECEDDQGHIYATLKDLHGAKERLDYLDQARDIYEDALARFDLFKPYIYRGQSQCDQTSEERAEITIKLLGHLSQVMDRTFVYAKDAGELTGRSRAHLFRLIGRRLRQAMCVLSGLPYSNLTCPSSSEWSKEDTEYFAELKGLGLLCQFPTH